MSSPAVRVPVTCPDFGDSTVRVGVWLAVEGTSVIEGEPLVDLILPGLCWTVAAPCDGRLVDARAREQSPVDAGQVLAWLEPDSRIDINDDADRVKEG